MDELLNVPFSINWGNYLTVSFGNTVAVKTIPEDIFVDILCHSSEGSEKTRRCDKITISPSNTNRLGMNMLVN